MKRPLTEDLLKTFVEELEDEINFYYVKEVKIVSAFIERPSLSAEN